MFVEHYAVPKYTKLIQIRIVSIKIKDADNGDLMAAFKCSWMAIGDLY